MGLQVVLLKNQNRYQTTYSILVVGPPGSGKTMLAKRLATILPDMTLDEVHEITKIHSFSGLLSPGKALIATRKGVVEVITQRQ